MFDIPPSSSLDTPLRTSNGSYLPPSFPQGENVQGPAKTKGKEEEELRALCVCARAKERRVTRRKRRPLPPPPPPPATTTTTIRNRCLLLFGSPAVCVYCINALLPHTLSLSLSLSPASMAWPRLFLLAFEWAFTSPYSSSSALQNLIYGWSGDGTHATVLNRSSRGNWERGQN